MGCAEVTDNDRGTPFVLEMRTLDSTMRPPAVGTERPVWSRIERATARVFQYGGFVYLRVLHPPLAYTNELEMTCLSGRFRLSVLTKAIEAGTDLRVWREPGNTPYRGTARFGDDEWDARTICTDVSVANRMFKDLFDHGELTEQSFRQLTSNRISS